MKVTKRILSWLLVVCTVVGLLPAIALTAGAIDSTATWTETAWASIPNGATIIIANTNNVALPSTTTSTNPAKTSITVSGSAGALTITPGSGSLDDIAWTVNGSTTSTDGVQLLQYGSTTVNLYMSSTSSNTALRVGENTSNNLFVMGEAGNLLKLASASRYVGEYVAGSDWRSYNSESGANYKSQSLKFYVLNSGASGGGGSELPDDGGDTGDTTIPVVSDVYMLVNDASGLIEGETYIIAAAAYDKAMSSNQKTANRGSIAVVKDGDLLYCEGADADGYVLQEFVLQAGTVSGTYAFYDAAAEGYIYSASSTANQLKTDDTLSANASWKITFEEVTDIGTVATLESQGAATRNWMRYNTNSGGLFASYAPTQEGMKDTRIYRKVYSLVTDLSQLQIGDDIVIAAAEADFAMSTTQNNNNRGQGDVTKNKYALTFTSTAAIAEFTLREGTTSGTYSFYDKASGKYIYAASSGNNYLRSEATLSANSSWTISVTSEGVATVLAQGTNTNNDLRYNAGSDIFSCYATTSTMQKIAIYRRTASAEEIEVTEYTVNFYVNNALDSTVTTTGAVTLPTASYSGWTFCGWVTEETDELIDGTSAAPTCLTGNTSVTSDTDYYAVFSKDDVYSTRPTTETSGATEAKIKIITGEGTAYFSTDGGKTQYGEAALIKGTEAVVAVNEGVELTLVIKPADGYRIACIEKASSRLYANTDYTYDATLGAYVYTFTTKASSGQNYFRISFLPRFSDGGYTATQITGWDNATASGLYVITGLASPEDYTTNNHDVATTYLLYGDDDTAADDGYEAIGRKSSALQLGSIGVALNPIAPFLMSGLNESHLMEISRYGNTEYFTIRLYGATETNYYLIARSTKAKEQYIYTADSYLDGEGAVNNYALWKFTYQDNGAVAIENHGWELAAAADTTGATATRYLKFNSANTNLQFRTYPASTTTVDFPILYSASKSSYKVTYSVEGSGSITALNTTTSSTVPSGSYQPTDSAIKFTFAPASGYKLESVTVDGVAVTVTDNTYTYTGLNKDINVVATYTVIPPATFTVQYYLNETLMTSKTVEAKSPYVLDTTVQLTYDGKTFPASDYSFDRATNGTTTYPAVNSPIAVAEGDTLKAYFSTTAVQREKTVTEITQMGAPNAALGGENSKWFTSANEQDTYTNVKQSYRVNLKVSSNDKIEEKEEGGETDVIIVIDHSNSMYPPYTTNAEYIRDAISGFADVVFANGNPSDNRIAIVQYDSTACLWNGSKMVDYAYTTNASAYSLSYDSCYMNTKSKVMAAVTAALPTPDPDYTMGGMTNTMGGLRMTEVMAKIRPTNTTRNLVIIMFTDGLPTCRYYTSTKDWYWDNDGTRTSAWEFARALEAGKSLRTEVDKYTKCESTIYNVALLNDEDMTAEDYKTADYFMSNGTIYQWSYDTTVDEDKYIDLRAYVNSRSKYFTATTPWADEYIPLKGKVDKTTLGKLYEDIAYTYVAGKLVTGTITDTIPACFKLTDASKAALIADGCTVTVTDEGTTITKPVTASKDGEGFTYDIVYQGEGYGSVYTNTEATFAYTNLQTDETYTSYFPQPTATVIPWTVNDRQSAEMNVPTTIDILKNDLFEELTEGGYTLSDFTVTLTDAYGNPVTYKDAVEQSGCGFDAEIDPASNTVTFYTEKGGVSTFYYVVSAKVTSPDGKTTTTVYSRATQVDVQVSKVDKYAQEVTNSTNLPDGVTRTTDIHGNVYQIYLVTLTVNLFDIQNGEIVDTIPSDFEFIRFEQTAGATCTQANNVVNCTGINLVSEGITISYYIRYKGHGYGAIPTNSSATLTYNQSGSSTTSEQEFPEPVAGLNPHTVNDVDIVKAGTENKLDITENDLYSEAGLTTGGYTVTDAKVYLTDENGNRLTEEEIEDLGLGITVNPDGSVAVNPDGSISYTAPNEETIVQFYYVVESTVTVTNDGTYAKDNSVTLISRPTLVTIYSLEDLFILVDFGLKTESLGFIDYSGVKIATDYEKGKDVLLEDILDTGEFNETEFGILTLDESTNMLSFQPGTPILDEETNTFSIKPGNMVFDETASYVCDVTMKASAYNSYTAKDLELHFDVLPANNIYYEENFLSFDNAWTDEASANGSAIQSAGTYHNLQLHGFDSVYATQETYSNGNAKAVTVSASDKEHTAYFTFAGTGFDIISSTNPNSGVMVVQVYKYDADKENENYCGELVKNILVDTYLKDKTYNQIPVVMYRAESYGIYRVKVRAFYNAIFDHRVTTNTVSLNSAKAKKLLGFGADEQIEVQKINLTAAGTVATKGVAGATLGQYNVYLDAVRVYNPLNTAEESVANEAAVYAASGELNPTFININDKLLDLTNWGYSASGTVLAEGMLYVAADDKDGGADDTTKYTAVYLSASGQLNANYDADFGAYFLMKQDGSPLKFNDVEGQDIYLKEVAEEDALAIHDGKYVAFYYQDMETYEEIPMTKAQVKELKIAFYDKYYEAIGPENEVYLKNDQGIALRVEKNVSVQISMKVPYGDGYVVLQAYDAATGLWKDVANISSRTEMYYRIDTNMIAADGLLILKCHVSDDLNTTANEKQTTVLSLCNIKIASGNPVSTGDILPLSADQAVRAIRAFDKIEKEEVEPKLVLDENLSFDMSVTVGPEMQVVYTIANGKVETFDSFYLEVTKKAANGDAKTTTYGLYELAEITQKGSSSVLGYRATFTGMNAKEMGDEFTATLYAVRTDGTIYYSESVTASVKSFLMAKLNDVNSGAELKTLAVDMLNYGAAAQLYFGYNVDSLANADLTAAQKALGTKTAPKAVDNSAVSGEGTSLAASVTVESKVNLYVTCKYETADASNVKFVIKDALTGDVLAESAPTKHIANKAVQCKYDNVGAKQMRQLLTIEVYDGDTLVSKTLTWSVESYVASTLAKSTTSTALANMVNAMLVYGDSVAAYMLAQ